MDGIPSRKEVFMRHLILLFIVLFGTFLGTWVYKIETPVNRPDEYSEGYSEDAGAWWNTGAIEVDDSWRLDPEIPLNYMPVPGENELYMVIDNNGNILSYRKRTKQIDGSWTWEDVNPDIPDGYEAVAGLENVYKVTAADGTVSYYRYVRNEDDTFAFVEVDNKGKPIGKNRDATTIDRKHVHITGNIYSELNDYGVTIGYDKRVQNSDGTFSWVETDMPNIPSLPDMGNITIPSEAGKKQEETEPGTDKTGETEPVQTIQPKQGTYNNGSVNVTPATPTIIDMPALRPGQGSSCGSAE